MSLLSHDNSYIFFPNETVLDNFVPVSESRFDPPAVRFTSIRKTANIFPMIMLTFFAYYNHL